MFEYTSLLTYIASCCVIILIPGPAQALVLSNTISNGKNAGILTAVGLNLATIFHSIAAALGLSAILVTSATTFSIVKFIGASYLIYIGIITFISKDESKIIRNKKDSVNNILSKAFLTGILNPKVAIFFLAFLPQFVDPSKGYVLLQFILLAVILGTLDVIYESVLSIIAGSATRWFVENKLFNKWRQRITGVVLIGLGIKLAFTQRD